jgi:hypothetical protein
MRRNTIPKNLGIILLAIWLIATGVLQLGVIAIAGLSVILGLLAIAAGILLLLQR